MTPLERSARARRGARTRARMAAVNPQLTPRQEQLRRFIERHWTACGRPPSNKNMRAALDLNSHGALSRLLSVLVARGVIVRGAVSVSWLRPISLSHETARAKAA